MYKELKVANYFWSQIDDCFQIFDQVNIRIIMEERYGDQEETRTGQAPSSVGENISK